MAVKKNPDFSVWLADVWHWASRPPGIYICIIVVLVAVLFYSLSSPTAHIATSGQNNCPSGTAWNGTSCTLQNTPTAVPAIPNNTRCPVGSVFISENIGCRRQTYTTPETCNSPNEVWVSNLNGCYPKQDNCSPPYHWDARAQSCIRVTDNDSAAASCLTDQTYDYEQHRCWPPHVPPSGCIPGTVFSHRLNRCVNN